MEANDRLELFFSQSLDGFFFMMLDEAVVWNDSVDKEKALDYIFEHQRVTKVNDAMLAQYGATREEFLGTTPADLFGHDLAYGRRICSVTTLRTAARSGATSSTEAVCTSRRTSAGQMEPPCRSKGTTCASTIGRAASRATSGSSAM